MFSPDSSKSRKEMPRSLQRSLQDYLSKIKKPQGTPPIQLPHSSFSASRSWVLSRCKHPKTRSFAIDRSRNGAGGSNGGDDAATLDDVDRFLFENFKSLYLRDDDGGGAAAATGKKGKGNSEKECGGGDHVLFESPRFVDPPPANLCGSNRFFVAPGSSSSLMEEARSSLTMSEDVASSSTSTATLATSVTTATTITDATTGSPDNSRESKTKVSLPDDSVAVLTHSTSPYEDFKRSMQEMVEARLQGHAKVDWEFMEELLFCYLNLNEKKSYKYILSAFVDLVVVLRRDRGGTPARRPRGKEGRRKTRREARTST